MKTKRSLRKAGKNEMHEVIDNTTVNTSGT